MKRPADDYDVAAAARDGASRERGRKSRDGADVFGSSQRETKEKRDVPQSAATKERENEIEGGGKADTTSSRAAQGDTTKAVGGNTDTGTGVDATVSDRAQAWIATSEFDGVEGFDVFSARVQRGIF
jgi:hypothetical protein